MVLGEVVFDFIRGGAGSWRICSIFAGWNHNNVLVVVLRRVFTWDVDVGVHGGAQPIAHHQLIEVLNHIGIVLKVLPGAGLKFDISLIIGDSIAFLHFSEGDIEVSLGVWQILFPNFDGKPKAAVLADLIECGRRDGILDDLSGGVEDVEVESVEDHAGKSDDDGDNDSQRYYAACEGFVL